MTVEDFDFVAETLRLELGIALSPEKIFLVQSRLQELCPGLGLEDAAQVVELLRQGKLKPEVAEAVTRQEITFFRDRTAYDCLRASLMPELMAARRTDRRLRIWSTAAGKGQEPYSIAMELVANLAHQLRDWTVEILASDSSTQLLPAARLGQYSPTEVQRGLPADYLTAFFTPMPENCWQLNDKIRSMVTFEQLNLRQIPEDLGRFDLIFCRNLLLYFDSPTRREVVQTLHRHLASDGYLLIGPSETLLHDADLFFRLNKSGSAVYRPVS